MTKQIKVSNRNHELLMEIKTEKNFKSIDEVICYLLLNNRKYYNGRIVRLVEE